MITLHVIVSNTTTVKMITEGRWVRNRPRINYVICEGSLSSYLILCLATASRHMPNVLDLYISNQVLRRAMYFSWTSNFNVTLSFLTEYFHLIK